MFVKGQSGNPGGRPKIQKDLQDAAREHSHTALKVLVDIVKSPKMNPIARVKAADLIIERGYGKAIQINGNINMDVENVDDSELVIRGRTLASRIGAAINGTLVSVHPIANGQSNGVHKQLDEGASPIGGERLGEIGSGELQDGAEGPVDQTSPN